MRHIAICNNSGIKRGKSDIPSVKYLEIFMGNALRGHPYLRNGRLWYCDKGNIGKKTVYRITGTYDIPRYVSGAPVQDPSLHVQFATSLLPVCSAGLY